jgi:hypothetical protein
VSDNAPTRFCPGVLYADRGVIALNKPPGLVSQGTEAGTVHSHSRENRLDAVPSKFAFNAVLDGALFVTCSIGRVISTLSESQASSGGMV